MIKLTAKHWLMILSLVFVAPLGLFLVARHYRFRKTVTWVLAAVFIPLFAAECAFATIYFVAQDLQRMSRPAIIVSGEVGAQSEPLQSPESSRIEPELPQSETESSQSDPEQEPVEPELPQSEAESRADDSPSSAPESSAIEPEAPQSETEPPQSEAKPPQSGGELSAAESAESSTPVSAANSPEDTAQISPPAQTAPREIPDNPGKPMPAPGTPGPR